MANPIKNLAEEYAEDGVESLEFLIDVLPNIYDGWRSIGKKKAPLQEMDALLGTFNRNRPASSVEDLEKLFKKNSYGEDLLATDTGFWREALDNSVNERAALDEILPEFGQINNRGVTDFLDQQDKMEIMKKHQLGNLVEGEASKGSLSSWNSPVNDLIPHAGIEKGNLAKLLGAPLYHRSRGLPVGKAIDHRAKEASLDKVEDHIYQGRSPPATYMSPDSALSIEGYGSNLHPILMPSNTPTLDPRDLGALKAAANTSTGNNFEELDDIGGWDTYRERLHRATDAGLRPKERPFPHPRIVDEIAEIIGDKTAFRAILGEDNMDLDVPFGRDYGPRVNPADTLVVMDPNNMYQPFAQFPPEMLEMLEGKGVSLNSAGNKIIPGQEFDESVDFFDRLLKRLGG